MKKLFSLILILSFVLACAFTLIGCVDKGNEYLTRAEVDVYLKENGNAEISETWHIKVEGEEIHNLYRVIELYDSESKTYSKVENLSVLNNKTGEYLAPAYDLKNPANYDNRHLDNHHYIYEKGKASGQVKSVEIGFYMPYTSYSELTYTMRYTVTDMVSVYDDCAVFYYNAFSDDFSLYIDEIELNVYLPGGEPMTESSLVYLHSEVADSYAEVIGNNAHATATEFQVGNYFEVRTVLPKEHFSGAQKVYSESKRQAVIDEETKWMEDYQATVLRERRTTVAWTVVGGVLVLIAIALAVYFKFFYYKVKGEYPPYVREIRPNDSPAEMAHFFYHYKGGTKKQKNRGNMLAGTIMDLARRGFVSLLPSPADKDDYVIEIESVADAKMGELKAHERTLLTMLTNVSRGVGKAFDMKDFESYSKKHPAEINGLIDKFVKESGAGFFLSENFEQTKLGSWLTILGGILMLGAFLFLGAPLVTYGAVGALISGGILVLFAPRAKRFSKVGLDRYMESKGLENFMLDFSNLKEHEIPALILWEEYMVYATMMGISERVIEELKLKYPELYEPATTTSYYRDRSYLYFYMYMHRTHNSFDLGRSLNTSLTNVSRSTYNLVQASKAQSSAKSGGSFGRSGGGFRGGGGGFGGGGGGAR
ncbi:MAG: DUF2207 domain-containing protein [Clostridia bacterium]|nr:DUF2207 domain-containing protein [Clostridia bacterium]